MKPIISVIMPVYNSEKYILEAINSILKQTLSDFEFIIINDASTDDTQKILNTITDKRIRRIDNISQKGNYWCRNIGMSVAKGCFIAVMDSDDASNPTRLASQYDFMIKKPDCIALGSAIEMFNNDKTFLHKRRYDSDENKILLLKDNICAHPSLMIRSEALKNNKIIYDESYTFASDYDLMVKLSQRGKIYNLPEVLLRYRIHQNQISIRNKKQQNCFADRIRIKQLEQILRIHPNPEEIKLHLSLMRDNIVHKDYLKQTENWFNKILNHNEKYKKYDHEKLFAFLKECYIRAMRI